eukprot:GHVH01006267.1.p1 GENE.GHVH01006267.1~~GHVH01006267.1.p1  ORF type:complete len:432 (+),score=61.88 GHVH01006267.1:140-1435(+)
MFFGGIPGFEGGGMPGGGRRGPVDNTKLYNILGVDKSASDTELKKAYRKLAMTHHPDKGGDTEKFQEISHAFEVLSDPDRRRIYDESGEEGLEAGGMGGHSDGMDIFDMFFGGGGRGGRGQSRGPPKTESVQSRMELDLAQIYKGITKQLAVQKDVICSSCDGNGGPADKIQTCESCQGQGFKVKIVRMGPMISQSRAPCDNCEQQGKFIPPRFRCKTCSGNKTIKQKKVLSCHIEPGCSDGKKIVFEGEADQRPGCEPGDVIVVVSEASHPVFKRQGDDLLFNKTIDVLDLVCGCSFDLTALDGRKLLIKVSPGLVTDSNQSRVIVNNEGMPRNGNQHVRGNLIINLVVNYPAAAPEQDSIVMLKQLLRAVPGCSGLPTPKNSQDDPAVEIANARAYAGNSSRRDQSNAYDEDEDAHESAGGQNVQCQAQ